MTAFPTLSDEEFAQLALLAPSLPAPPPAGFDEATTPIPPQNVASADPQPAVFPEPSPPNPQFESDESFAQAALAGPDEPTNLEAAANSAKAFLRSLARGIAGIPKSVSIAAKALDEAFPDSFFSTKDKDLKDYGLFQLGQALEDFADTHFKGDPRLRDSFLSETLPAAFGSTGSFILGGAVARGLKGSSLMATALLGSGAEASSLFDEAKASGASDDDAMKAAGLGAIVGLSEAVPINRMFKRFDRASGGAFKKRAIEIVREGFTGGAEELIQETFQGLAGNRIARDIFDKERNLVEGVGKAGGAGGIVGFFASAAATAAGITLRRGRTPQGAAETAPVQPAETAPLQPAEPQSGLTATGKGEVPIEVVTPESIKRKLLTLPGALEFARRQTDRARAIAAKTSPTRADFAALRDIIPSRSFNQDERARFSALLRDALDNPIVSQQEQANASQEVQVTQEGEAQGQEEVRQEARQEAGEEARQGEAVGPLPGTTDVGPKPPQAPAPKVGDKVRGILGDSVLAKIKKIDGVRYELYKPTGKEGGVVRVFDEDGGRTATIHKFPSFEAANKEFDKAVELAGTPGTPAQPTQAPAPKAADKPTPRQGREGTPADRFTALARAQRDEPERKMLRIQDSQISQLYGVIAEDVGDLTHRMSEHITTRRGNFGAVREKVDKALLRLTTGLGIRREIDEQIEANLPQRDKVDKALLRLTTGLGVRGEIDEQIKANLPHLNKKQTAFHDAAEALARLKELGRDYAEAHKALPVVNKLHQVAQRAAVAVGEFRFQDAIDELHTIEAVIKKGKKNYEARATEGLAAPLPRAPAERAKALRAEVDRILATAKTPDKPSPKNEPAPARAAELFDMLKRPRKQKAGKVGSRFRAADPEVVGRRIPINFKTKREAIEFFDNMVRAALANGGEFQDPASVARPEGRVTSPTSAKLKAAAKAVLDIEAAAPDLFTETPITSADEDVQARREFSSLSFKAGDPALPKRKKGVENLVAEIRDRLPQNLRRKVKIIKPGSPGFESAEGEDIATEISDTRTIADIIVRNNRSQKPVDRARRIAKIVVEEFRGFTPEQVLAAKSFLAIDEGGETEQVKAGDLNVGDSLDIQGEEHTVVESDRGTVVLQDDLTLAVPEDATIAADAGSIKEGEGDVSFNFGANAPATDLLGQEAREPTRAASGPQQTLSPKIDEQIAANKAEAKQRRRDAIEGQGNFITGTGEPTERGTGKPTDRPDDPVLGASAGSLSMPMRLERPSGIVQPTAATEVMEALVRAVVAFGGVAPVRTGRIKGRRALGQFEVQPEIIRIRVANDIPTAAHEVAHAIEKAVFGFPKGGPFVGSLISRPIQAELLKMGRNLYGKSKPAGGYKREGFAEFVRFYVTDRARAKKEAPMFFDFFEGKFLAEHPKGAAAIDAASKLSGRFQEQGSLERGRQGIVDAGSTKARLSRAKDTLAKATSFTTHVDMLQPLFVFTKEVEERLGRKLLPSESPQVTAQALRLTHDARVREMVQDGMMDPAGNRVGGSLAEAAAIVKGRQQDFAVYLWAKRAAALWQDPQKPSGRNPGLSLEDAQQIISELETPEFQLAASKVYDWNDGVLNYAAALSPTFAEAVDRIREVDPGYYIPLAREFKRLDGMWAKSVNRGSAAAGTIGKRLKGSGRRIKDPFPQMISNARNVVKSAHDRVVLDQLLKLSKVEGMGRFAVKLSKKQVPVLSQTVGEIIDKLNKQLAPLEAGVTLEGDGDLLSEAVTFFMPQKSVKPGENPILPIYNPETKTTEFYELDAGLFRSLEGMEQYRLPQSMKVLEWALAKPARLFRAGTTGLRASFGLVTNPQRDVQTMYVNSQANSNGLQLLAAWAQSMGDAATRLSTGKRNPFLGAFVRLGGEMAQPLGQDVEQARRASRQLFQGRIVKTLDPRNWFDWFRDLVQAPESAPRVAELKRVAKDLNWEPGQPMTFDQSLQLLLAAKQVTTDFSAAGEFSRVMNQMVPFYNAAIQGPRANLRAARRNPRRFILRSVISITAPTLLLWWLHKDEDWYKEMRAKQRFLFWHIPIDSMNVLVRIPRAFEVGQLFGSFPEMALDSLYRTDPSLALDFFDTVLDTLVPDVRPVLLKEALQQARNFDDFWERPVVSMRLLRKPEEEQFDDYTSRAAIALGDLFNASPRRIDHAIRGIGGGVAADVLDVLGLGPKGVKRQKELADTPVIGRMFTRGGQLPSRTRSMEKMYEALHDAQLLEASDRTEETKDQRQVRLMLSDAVRAVGNLAYVRSQTASTAKRAALTKEANSIARDVLNQASKGPSRDRFQLDRKRTDFLKKSTAARRNGDDVAAVRDEFLGGQLRSITNPSSTPAEKAAVRAMIRREFPDQIPRLLEILKANEQERMRKARKKGKRPRSTFGRRSRILKQIFGDEKQFPRSP